jgi:pre-mRNA-processing factor 6
MGPPGVRHATSALRELTSIGGVRTAPEREDYSESNYDEWSGYGGSLFAQRPQGASATSGYLGVDDAEDNEADQLFNRVDEFMDGRRKKKREEKMKKQEEEIKKEKSAKADYQAQFSDIKRQLAGVSRNEWESLPDAPDLVKRTKK